MSNGSLNRYTSHKITKLWWIPIGGAGAFGGMATNLFRFGTDMTHGDPLPTASYFIGVIIFALMGAGLALSFREDDVKKAFFLGLSLPAMFQSSINATSQHVNEANAAGFTPPAIVEEAPRTFVIIPQLPEAPEFQVRFMSADEKRREEQTVPAREASDEKAENVRIEIPAWAAAASLVYRTSESQPVFLTRTAEQEFYVIATRDFWSGIKQSAGVSGVAEYTIELISKAEFEKRKE